jgi:hypothetical protein
VRGDPARTVRGRLIQREVAEYILTKDAGLTRRDIHGVERRGRHVERRHDIAATTRRTLGRVGRRRFAMGVATLFGTIGIATALGGLESTGLFVAVVGVAVAAAIDRYAPDVVFDGDVAPKAIVVEEHEPGMSGDEYARRLAIHSKRNEVKEEKIEKRRKEHERKAKANRRTF